MSKKTYYTSGITATAIAALLDLLTGESFTSGPIALIYMGFLLGFITAYWTTWATYQRSQQHPPRQGRI